MIICWYCDRETDIKEDNYGDHQCPHCGIELSVYNPTDSQTEQWFNNTTCDEWLNEEEEMPNLNDLSEFLKRDDIKAGDILTFTDAGEIAKVDFSKTKDGSGVKTVFQIGVMLPDGRKKIITLNKASQTALSEKYGKITEEWVGKNAMVSFVEQMAFGKLIEVLILKSID